MNKPVFRKFTSLLLCLVTLFSVVLAGCNDSVDDSYSTLSSSYITTSSLSAESSQEQTESHTQESKSEPSAPATESSLPQGYTFTFQDIPEYSGRAYVALNNNTPSFTAKELSSIGEERYSALDSLGRCGTAFAVCGKEIMPKSGEKRGSISHIKPSGWVQAQYNNVSGKYLYNRCHLLGWQLSAENDNPRNLITGTRYMNTEGMLPFENMIADYIKETGNHVAYRVTPRFKGNNLLAMGVQLEAYSIEDQGEGICFHVYVYNVQPGITIYYATGKSTGDVKSETSSKTTSSRESGKTSSVTASSKASSKISSVASSPSASKTVYVTPTGKRYHYRSTCGGKNSTKATLEEAKARGLTPCKKCAS